MYQTHDITDRLKNGENVIGSILGAGWYKGRMGLRCQRNNYGDKAAFLCQLELKYTDGSHETIVTDGSWRGSDSPVRKTDGAVPGSATLTGSPLKTFWEHWDGKRPDGSMWSPKMNSFNHYAYGAIGEWLYRVVAGIEPDESEAGFKHIIVEPHIGGGLDDVKACYSSIYGDISVEWKKQGERVALDVSIPHNTKALIRLNHAQSVHSDPCLELEKYDDAMIAHAGSGRYRFSYVHGA